MNLTGLDDLIGDGDRVLCPVCNGLSVTAGSFEGCARCYNEGYVWEDELTEEEREGLSGETDEEMETWDETPRWPEDRDDDSTEEDE